MRTSIRVAMLGPAFLVILFSLSFPFPANGKEIHCPPDSKARLVRSIAKIQTFIDHSRHSSSFNFDRLDYLLQSFKAHEELWVTCGPPKGSLHEKQLRHRLRILRERLAQERSLPPGNISISPATIREINRLFSGLPLPPSPVNPKNGGEPNKGTPQKRFPLSRPLLIIAIVMAGVMALLASLRLSKRHSSGVSLLENRWEAMKALGEKWSRFPNSRNEIVNALKQTLAQGKKMLRIRAQLLKKEKESGDWKVVDEVMEDEEGGLRPFGMPVLEEVVAEKVTEVPLSEGELRTRIVVPLSEKEGEERVLVVDAHSSLEFDSPLPDPSGLKRLSEMKERLFEASFPTAPGKNLESIGVVSVFFDDPDKSDVLIKTDEEALLAKKFIVEELKGVSGSSLSIFGEAPGFFHLVPIGLSELETGVLIRKIAEGLGHGPKKGATFHEKPWFRKMLVAYTKWKEPDPEKIDLLIDQIHGNLEKLQKNPSIKTVIDA